MSENNAGMSPDLQEFLRKMKAIGSDLWGEEPRPLSEQKTEGAEKEQTQPSPADFPEAKGMKTAEKPEKRPDEKKTATIENLWKTADETIDWTDALGHDEPTDGLTSLKMWSYYHGIAERVLQGDIRAYADVLKTVNPLGDLTDYAARMTLRAPDAERLECVFECSRDALEKDGRRYLSALSLRIARDLFAALPVAEVYVQGFENGIRKIGVTYERKKMLKKNFSFIDPVAFAEECGAYLE